MVANCIRSLQCVSQSILHDSDGFGVVIDERKVAALLVGGFAESAAAGEEVQDAVAGVGMDADDAAEYMQRLLGSVTRLLLAGDDGVPPNVGWGLAAGGFLRPDEPGSQVGESGRWRRS